MTKPRIWTLPMAVVLLILASAAYAHKPSDSYLTLMVERSNLSGQWDIALRDLDHAIGIDLDGDRAITWGEVKSRLWHIDSYALSRLGLATQGGACTLNMTDHLINEHSDGRYASLMLTGSCPSPIDRLVIDYHLMFDLDPLHRGLLSVNSDGLSQTHLLSPGDNRLLLDVHAASFASQAISYLKSGIWHIWIGVDHIVFLVTLLFGSFLTRRNGVWCMPASLRSSLFHILAIVTAFTVAHSITLALAVLNVVNLPSAPVETLIAASIVVAALNNLHPFVTRRLWLLALVFGLVHGFGFASALSNFGLPFSSLALGLISFNLGVELGQIAVVSLFVLLALFARSMNVRLAPAATLSQVAIAAAGTFWIVERWPW